MNEFDIRPLQPSDCLEQLTALLHAAYASLAAQGWNFTAANQSVAMTRERATFGQAFVAYQGERLVGTVSVSGPKPAQALYIQDPAPSLYTQPGTAILSQLAVHPDCRGLGLAERLIDCAEAWARAQGHARIALDTAQPALSLRQRYQRRGFVEGDPIQWTGKTYASVLMCKPLIAEAS